MTQQLREGIAEVDPLRTLMIKSAIAQERAADVSFVVPFRTQQPLGVVVNRPSVWPDR
jgi:hypothetical protein